MTKEEKLNSYLMDSWVKSENDKAGESGRSMVEMLGTLAIMGVLSVGGVAGYRYAMDKFNANTILNEVSKRAMTASQQRLIGQPINLNEYGVAKIQDFDVGHTNDVDGDTAFFSLSVAGVPKGVCDKVIENKLRTASQVYVGETDVTDGGTCDDDDSTIEFVFANTLDTNAEPGAEPTPTPDPTPEPTPEPAGPCIEYGADGETCTKCNAGYYLTASGCTMCQGGTYSAAGATACTDCPSGTNAEPGSSTCTAVTGECGYGEVIYSNTLWAVNNPTSVIDNDGVCDASCPGKCYGYTSKGSDQYQNGFEGRYVCENGSCTCIIPTDDPCKSVPDSNATTLCNCYCLAAGTQITLANGQTKAIEDITYDDDLLVWDFDKGAFASAKPLWIQKKQIASQYNLLTFSDGSTLKTINQHRIFNKEAGKFTYPMTDDTPIGTTTFTADGREVTLVSKEVIVESVDFYNIITDYHMNCFANGILTSCRLSNLYPIRDMKYVTDNRDPVPYEGNFDTLPRKWYDGLRLAEQPTEINRGNDVVFVDSITGYVQNLISLAV